MTKKSFIATEKAIGHEWWDALEENMTNEANTYQYLVQRIAMAVQRGNAASVLGLPGSRPGGLGDL